VLKHYPRPHIATLTPHRTFGIVTSRVHLRLDGIQMVGNPGFRVGRLKILPAPADNTLLWIFSRASSRAMAKILVADDSRFQVQMLASRLTPLGFEVISAADALQTWMAALRSSPDVILLDINMPGGTGIEVLKRLGMSTKTQFIPVIVVSGDENPDTEVKARGLGAVAFLHKPVDEEQLRVAVNRALNKEALPDQLGSPQDG